MFILAVVTVMVRQPFHFPERAFIVICSVAGVVNALAVRRELHARREQEYHARGRTAIGERILRERYEKFRRRRQH